MLDNRTRAMLDVANELTAEELDLLRGPIPDQVVILRGETMVADEPPESIDCNDEPRSAAPATPDGSGGRPISLDPSRGAYERGRTRASKVATGCLGREREKHAWWPVGTELVGRIDMETFTAVVIENPAVKSGRSLRITAGPAAGKVCLTPTRAAIEATEPYRASRNLGRAGGVTNGWEFWKQVT